MIKEVKFKVLDKKAKLSGYASKGAAAFDLVTTDSAALPPGSTKIFGTGVAVELPEGCVGLICPRSGLAANSQITVLNAPGVIDEDYRGEVKVILHNAGEMWRQIEAGDRVAQMLIVKAERCHLSVSEYLTETDRGENGIGSTGK